VLGYEISKYLRAPLDLVITRKIGYPGNEECAVAAVAEDGHMLCDSSGASLLDSEWLQSQAELGMREAARRREVYLKGRPALSPEGKAAIIVDDGVATGLTVLLAVGELRHFRPEKVIVAVPVASRRAADLIRKEADDLVVLEIPRHFEAVGAYYESFPQLSDEEVIELMSKGRPDTNTI